MKSLFMTGIQNPRTTFWLGQQYAFVTATPTQSTTTPSSGWESVVASALQAGASAYGSYASTQVAEEAADAKRAEIAAKAASDRTAQILQQTQLMQQQSIAQGQSAGMDKTLLYIGAGLLGLMAIGGIFYMMSRK